MDSTRTAPTRRARAAAAIALLGLAAALAPAPVVPGARAAYPGRPGPIAYSKYEDVIDPEFHLHQRGGLVVHGPHRDQRPWQLTGDAGDSNPAYSPDGRWIAFDGSRGAGGFERHVYVVRAGGSGLRQLTDAGDVAESEPGFSPDGRRLVFVRSWPERGISHLFLLTIASGAVRQLTFGRHADREPVFAPSGKRILFSSDRAASGGADGTDIWEIAPNGRNARVLVNGPSDEVSPDVAPYGHRIAFVVPKHSNLFGVLHVARRNGRRGRALGRRGPECRPCYSQPAFAPDGRHIAAIESRSRGGSTVLKVMRADGTHTRYFDGGTVEVEGFGGHVAAPSWGPRPRR